MKMTHEETVAALKRARVEYGHDLKDDDPGALHFSTQRWTCGNCGLAVIRYLGNVYGGALDAKCLGGFKS